MKRLLTFALVVCAQIFAQNAALMPMPRLTFLDTNGVPLSGGYLYTCVAGTSCTPALPGRPAVNPLATYTDSSAGVSNSNPIVLDAAGRANVWLGSGTYKIVAQDQFGVTQWSQDNVSSFSLKSVTTSSGAVSNFSVPGTLTAGSIVGPVTYTASGTGAVARTVQTKLQETVSVLDFGAKCDGSTDDTAAIQAAINASSSTGAVLIPATTACIISAGLQIANRSGLTITATGTATIRFKAGTTDTLYNSWPTFGQDSIIRILNSSNITIRNLTLDGNIQNRTAFAGSESMNSDLTIAGSSDVFVDNCSLINGMTDGVNVMSYPSPAYNSNVWITNSILTANRRNNISVVAGHGVHVAHDTVTGAGTVQGTAPKSGIDIEPSINSTDVQDVVVDSSTFSGNTNEGIRVYVPATLPVANVRASNNYVSGNGTFGISFENTNNLTNACAGCSIVNNQVFGNTSVGIRVRGQTAGVISGNLINNNATGIVLYEVVDLLVSGNHILNNTTGGIALGSSGFSLGFTSATITGNEIHDNANAASIAGIAGWALDAYSGVTTSRLYLAGNTIYSSVSAATQQRGVRAAGAAYAAVQLANVTSNLYITGGGAVFTGAWTAGTIPGLTIQNTPGQTAAIQNWAASSGTVGADVAILDSGFNTMRLYRNSDAAQMGQFTYNGSGSAGAQWFGLNNVAGDYLNLNSQVGSVKLGTGSIGRITTEIDSSGNFKLNLIPSTTGTRYLCIGTTGIVTSSATACSGT